MLAGPGTGKTTTLVEAIVRRIEDGADPSRVLALTFSRKAAEQLRDRVTARLGRTLSTQLSSTFHSFAYGLVRLHAPAELYAAPLRLLSAPEQDVVLQELLTDNPESVTWPEPLRAAVGTRGFAREVHAVLSRARERGLDPDDLVALGRAEKVPEFEAAGLFLQPVPRRPRRPVRDRLPRPDRPGGHRGQPPPRRAARPVQPRLRGRVPGHRPGPGRAAPRAGRRRPRPDRRGRPGPVDLRLPRRRGARHPRLPARVPDRRRQPAPVIALGTTRRFGSRLLRASRNIAASIAVTGSIPAETYAAFRQPEPADNAFGPGQVEVLTFDTARAEIEHIADLLRRAHLEDGIGWSEMAVLVRSGRASIPSLRRALGAAGVPGRGGRRRHPAGARARGAAAARRARRRRRRGDRRPAPRRLRRRRPGGGAADLGARRPRRDRGTIAHARHARPRPEHARPASWSAGRSSIRRRSTGLDGEPARRATRLAGLLADARAALADGSTVEEVLWTLWDGSDWGAPPARGHPGRRPGRPAGPPRPRRDLRAVRERRARRGAEGPHQRPLRSSRRCGPRRSPPTPSPTAACGATRYGCSRRTGPRAWSGGWSSSRTSRKAPGRTCAAAATLLRADRIGPRRAAPADHHARRCWPRSGGCSTSR